MSMNVTDHSSSMWQAWLGAIHQRALEEKGRLSASGVWKKTRIGYMDINAGICCFWGKVEMSWRSSGFRC